jgi:polyisoprenoid-binding protein YceI
MHTTIFSITVIACSILSSIIVQQYWNVEHNSNIKFTVTNAFFFDVHGTLDFARSKIEFDPNNLDHTSIEVVLKVSSINTGNAERDKHLNNEDFFDTNRFPYITFIASTAKKSVNGTYTLTGNLTIKDISKVVTIPFTFSSQGDKATFKGGFSINRLDYKIGEKYSFGISKQVKIELYIPVSK